MAELRRTYNRRTAGQKASGRGSRRARKKRNPAAAGILILLAVLLAAGGIFLFRRYSPGNTWSDYQTFYGTGAEGTVVFCNGEQAEGEAVSRNGRLYLPVSLASQADCKWYYSDEGLLLYSLANETVRIAPSSHTYTAGGQTVDVGYEIFYAENGIAYVCADFMADFAGTRVQTFPADAGRNLPARVYLDHDWGTKSRASAAGTVAVRELAGIKSPILTEAQAGSTLLIMDSVDDWTRVRTEDGFTGYVKTSDLEQTVEYELASSVLLPEYTSVRLEGKVCMAWHQVFSAADNGELSSYLEGTSGINVLSPTWFSVADNSGNLNSLADASYVQEAHGRGIQVWALIDDFDSNIDLVTLLSSTAAREHMISQLMTAVSQYQLDGINVDFENVKEDSAPHFLQFIRELSIACRQAGKTLSIDNYVPSGGRSWYNLKEQGQVADYVVIMGYDEHYKGCCSGTNASIGFSERGIADTLKSVPADKVVNGIPFFMRVWQETPEENAPADAELYDDGRSVYEGRYARDSRAVGMNEASQLLAEHGVTPQWLEDLGQYYGQYEENGSTWRIWLEDACSVGLKMEKVQQYGIAGAAFWKLGLESSDVWPVISQYLQ